MLSTRRSRFKEYNLRTCVGEFPSKFVGALNDIPHFGRDRVHTAAIERLDLLHRLVRKPGGFGVAGWRSEEVVDDEQIEVDFNFGNRFGRGRGLFGRNSRRIDIHGMVRGSLWKP